MSGPVTRALKSASEPFAASCLPPRQDDRPRDLQNKMPDSVQYALFASGFPPSGTIVSHDFPPVDDAAAPSLTRTILSVLVPVSVAAAAAAFRVEGPRAALTAAAALVIWLVAFSVRGTRMRRPCALFWHCVTGVAVVYCAALAAALFSPLAASQSFLAALDPRHATGPGGSALAEKSYADDCAFTLGNVRAQTDLFVAAHVLGWVGKAIMFRDVWASLALSAIFEFAEYTFTYLLPNFNECWWDHWLLDFALCNGAGIVIGHAVLRAVGATEYNWFGLSPRARADAAFPLGAAWRASVAGRSASRVAGVLGFFALVIAVDLNAFFLKFIMNVQPKSFLNPARLVLMAFAGAAAFREYYGLMTRGRLPGAAGVVALVGILLELALIAKHAPAVDAWRDARMPEDIKFALGVAVGVAAGGAVIAWLGASRGGGADTTAVAVVAEVGDSRDPPQSGRRRKDTPPPRARGGKK